MDDMNQSIYTECVNLSPDHVAWLDGCGAKWGSGDRLSELKSYTRVEFMCVDDTWYFMSTHNNSFTHIPTGFEFCERVAEILGIEKPVFGKSLDEMLSENCHIQQIIDENSGPTFAEIDEALKGDPKDMPFNYPHRTYRVLDSLDSIPLDKRIPLSEWIPPPREKVLLITGERYFEAWVQYIDNEGIRIGSEGLDFFTIADGHWMRIV